MKIPTIGIVVDASTVGGNPGYSECRGVDLETGEIVFEEKLGVMTNNAAEYCAIAYGAEYIKYHNIDVPIYSDSQICIRWVKRKAGCKTNIFKDHPKKAAENKNLAQIIMEAEDILNTFEFELYFWNNRIQENPADYDRK